jgi:hypothetical protein
LRKRERKANKSSFTQGGEKLDDVIKWAENDSGMRGARIPHFRDVPIPEVGSPFNGSLYVMDCQLVGVRIVHRDELDPRLHEGGERRRGFGKSRSSSI